MCGRLCVSRGHPTDPCHAGQALGVLPGVLPGPFPQIEGSSLESLGLPGEIGAGTGPCFWDAEGRDCLPGQDTPALCPQMWASPGLPLTMATTPLLVLQGLSVGMTEPRCAGCGLTGASTAQWGQRQVCLQGPIWSRPTGSWCGVGLGTHLRGCNLKVGGGVASSCSGHSRDSFGGRMGSEGQCQSE